MRMKAAIYYGPRNIRVEEVERPAPGDTGVIVKVGACGVCPILDLDAWLRGSPEMVGVALGHEWSGEIIEVGPKARDFNIGERIYQNPVFLPCFKCASCLAGDYWRCINWMKGLTQKGVHGAYAEYLWIPFVTVQSAAKLPKDLSFRNLALIEPLYLAVGLSRKGKPGDNVVILGVELMSLGTIAKLKERDIKVIACDVSDKRLRAAKEVGADITTNELTEDPVKVVMRETEGQGADSAIVVDPRPKAVFDALRMVKRAGQIWLATAYSNIITSANGARESVFWIGPDAGYTEPPIRFDPALAWVQTAWGTLGPRVPRLLEAVELIKSGKITAEKYVTKVFPLEKISEAFEAALHPDTIRVLVEP